MKHCMFVAVSCVLVGLSRTQVKGLPARYGKCPNNRVGVTDFTNLIASGDFLAIYTVEVNTENTYVKPKSVFTGNADTFSYVTVAYNEDTSMCQEFDSADADVDVRREFRFRCLRFDNYVVTQKGDQETRFISQDPSRYFWWFICLDGSARSFASCDEGFFDLNIPDNRETEELDLAGLPWDKIAEDLEDFTGLQFDDVRDDVKYAWLGEECDLHGGR